MADIYRYEWTGPQTGIEYRLDMYQKSLSPLPVTPDIVVLHGDAIESLGAKWEVNTLPFGMYSPSRLNVRFKRNRIPSELKSWLLFPYSDPIGLIVYEGAVDVGIGITLSTVFVVSGRVPGNADYQRFYVGVQDPAVSGPDMPFESNLTPSHDMDVEVEDVLRYAMKQVRFEDLDVITRHYMNDHPTSVTSRTCAIDYIWRMNSPDPGGGPDELKWFLIGNVVRGNNEANEDLSRYWAMSWVNDMLFGIMTTAVDGTLRHILRTNTPSGSIGLTGFTIKAALASFYDWMRKQTYSSDPIAGDYIGTGFVQVIAALANQDAVAGANVSFTLWMELAKSYPCVWDWFVDAAKNGYKTGQVVHNSNASGSYQPLVRTYDPAGVGIGSDTNVTHLLRNARLQLYRRQLRIVDGSTSQKIEQDLDKLSATRGGARADLDYTVPVVHTPAPVAGGYRVTRPDPYQDGQATRFYTTFGKEDGTIAYGFAPRLLSFYYLDRVADGPDYALQKEELIRAHSWCAIKNDGETVSPPSTSPTAPMPNVRYDGRQFNATVVALAAQRSEGYIAQVPQKLMDTFGRRLTAEASGDLPLSAGMIADTSGYASYMFAFAPYLCRWIMNWNEAYDAEPELSGAPSTFWMTKCDANMKTEIASCEFFGMVTDG